MSETSRNNVKSNQGIIASNVNAEVLAVGENASATKNVVNQEEVNDLLQLLGNIENLLRQTTLDVSQIDILRSDLSLMKEQVHSTTADQADTRSTLSRFVDKLKIVQSAMGDSAEIFDSVKSIAKILQIPLKALFL